MTLSLILASGALIGLILGLIGGGGSIIAVPLLLAFAGLPSTHMAIGTAAVAVALNAVTGLAGHWTAGTVKWPCAMVFGLASAAGAVAGSQLGLRVDGDALLWLFGLLMVGVGASMLRRRRAAAQPDVRLTRATARHLVPRLVPMGLGVGVLAGFFGIGGGFLIVPGLIAATRMPMVNAVGTSLVAIAGLGSVTALSYGLSGQVDWSVAGLLVAGGVVGAGVGVLLGRRLASQRRWLEIGFGAVVVVTGLFIAGSGLMGAA